MTIDHRSASATLEELLRSHTTDELLAKLAPKLADPAAASRARWDRAARRWSSDGAASQSRERRGGVALDAVSGATAALYARNIENFIGTVRVPVGLAGPLRVNGPHAQGDFYVPLATTEAALVASYSRGAQLITEAGGCAASSSTKGVEPRARLRVRDAWPRPRRSSRGPSALRRS